MPPTDVVVVMPGILGSTLGQDGHLVWAPSAGSVLRATGTFGAAVKPVQPPTQIARAHPRERAGPNDAVPDLQLVPLGTRYRGAAGGLAQLVDGAPYGLGAVRVDLTGGAGSVRSLPRLLHDYACPEQGRGLVKTTEVTLPELDTVMVVDAMAFPA